MSTNFCELILPHGGYRCGIFNHKKVFFKTCSFYVACGMNSEGCFVCKDYLSGKCQSMAAQRNYDKKKGKRNEKK